MAICNSTSSIAACPSSASSRPRTSVLAQEKGIPTVVVFGTGARGQDCQRACAEQRWREVNDGFQTIERYSEFGKKVKATKRRLLEFLIEAEDHDKRIAGYGAPGKSNALLNYCGIGTDFLDFTTDADPYKQGKYTREPASRFTTREDW
jgi:hypothetical protein